MKVPVEWLKEYVNINKPTKEIAEAFTMVGLMLDKPLGDGKVLDLEHRMDRSDWLSMIGAARDLAAYEQLELKMPALNLQKGKQGGGVKVEVNCPEVRRFNTRVFRGVKVAESPEWLKRRLTEYGMTPINNIVDITNYVMVELGNPMHAQDLAKFEKQEIVIRHAKNGEKITTLDGSVVELDDQAFVLTQNDEPIVIGGVVGGQKTSVDFNTRDIVLDAGNYDQASVRKTARKLKIQNETVLRYDKFLHPKLTEIALERATLLILELAGGEFFENDDYYPNIIPDKKMGLRFERVEQLSGMKLAGDKITDILVRLGYKVLKESESQLELSVPYFRTDVEVEDDVVSDVLRINGYDKIPTQSINTAPPVEITPEIYKYEEKIRDALVNLGLHEHITDPLVAARSDSTEQIVLENSQSSEKNALRTDMAETLVPVTSIYKKHGIKEVGLFEIGRIYRVKGSKNKYDNYEEIRVVEVVYESPDNPYEKSLKVKEIYYGLLHILGVDDKNVGSLRYNGFTIETKKMLASPKKNLRVANELLNKITEDLSVDVKSGESFGPMLEKIQGSDQRIYKVWVANEYFENSKRSILVRLEFLEKDITAREVSDIKKTIADFLAK